MSIRVFLPTILVTLVTTLVIDGARAQCPSTPVTIPGGRYSSLGILDTQVQEWSEMCPECPEPSCGDCPPPGTEVCDSPSPQVDPTSGGPGSFPPCPLSFAGATMCETAPLPLSTCIDRPDTMGAIGPNHFVEFLNGHVSIYDRCDGTQVGMISQRAFFDGIIDDMPPDFTPYDIRILFDTGSGRWFAIALDSTFPPGLPRAQLLMAVSYTDDPMGKWFKFKVLGLPDEMATGSSCSDPKPTDSIVDYSTLGVNEEGVFVAAIFLEIAPNPLLGPMVWAFDKADILAKMDLPTPVASPPHYWCDFSSTFPAGAPTTIQPAHTYGTTGTEYLIATETFAGSAPYQNLHVFSIVDVTTIPTLTWEGDICLPAGSEFSSVTSLPVPLDHLGATGDINVVDARLMQAVYRADLSPPSLWTSHHVQTSGVQIPRAEVRWYRIDPSTLTLVDSGTISDDHLDYYFPSIAVNKQGDVAMGFSGSSISLLGDPLGGTRQISAYYTGKLAAEAQMGVPQMLHAGEAYFGEVNGTPTWGDYSHTSLDPLDGLSFWTIQEYAACRVPNENIWGTWIGELSYVMTPITGVESRVVHGSAGELPITITSKDTVEPRQDGGSKIEIGFTRPLDETTAQDESNITITGKVFGPVSLGTNDAQLSTDGLTLTITFSQLTGEKLANIDLYTFDLSQLTDTAGCVLKGKTNFKVGILEGDANRDGLVDPFDSGFVLARFGLDVTDPANTPADVNSDGAIDPLDSGYVLARFGQMLP